jgi:hypothetical protein
MSPVAVLLSLGVEQIEDLVDTTVADGVCWET